MDIGNCVSGMQIFHDKEQGNGAGMGLAHNSPTMAPIFLPAVLFILWYVYLLYNLFLV